jgi:ActR/RegA family two-component response regulator
MNAARRQSNHRIALLVHPNLAALSSLQQAFANQGFTTLVARDLPTALLSAGQNWVDTAVISSKIAEEGDGWSLGGVLRMAFPEAILTVIAPETNVLTLQAAINHGLNRIFEPDTAATEMARFASQQFIRPPFVMQSPSRTAN